MRQRMERLVAAGVAAGLGCALLAAAPARADDGSTFPTPSPSAEPSLGFGTGLGGAGTATPTGMPGVSGGAGGAGGAGGSEGADGAPARQADPLTTLGGLAGVLVTPLFERLLLTAGAVVTAQQAKPAAPGDQTQQDAQPGELPGAQPDPATLQPGGGTSATSSTWRPRADIQVPTAVAVPPRGGGNGPLTKEQVIWAAYTSAAAKRPSCRIPVMLLAAIGEVESSSLRGRRLDASHDAVPPVRGPALTGGSYAAIRDSDGGRFDGDPVWDRAVGPMQFIPATWRIWGADGNGDGIRDPQNIEDAALAAAGYLCAGGRDLSQAADLRAAVLSYNHSQRYLATVVGIIQAVTSGALAGP
ncbi:lytic transglycosylase domain-containing protein [Terrabacter terrigena]|uniref:Lytic transglycosylase domain-containing protein n=1 Tax=Terrabacter terrigena TaxID=574718 RepID=A0ABW3N0T1_9MICO